MLECSLFSDAEAAENHPEQVVGGEFAGNFTQRLLRQTEFLGKEFERRQRAFDDVACGGGVFLRGGQGAQVALAGDEDILGLMPAGDAQQFPA